MADTPPLICPTCNGRIGNRRSSCGTCNRFTQTVARRTCAALKTAFADTAATLRTQVETEVYTELTGDPQ